MMWMIHLILLCLFIDQSLCVDGHCNDISRTDNDMDECDGSNGDEDMYNLAILTGDHDWSGTNDDVYFSYAFNNGWSNWYYLDKCDHDDFRADCYWEYFLLAGSPFADLSTSTQDFKFELAICGGDGLQVDSIKFANWEDGPIYLFGGGWTTNDKLQIEYFRKTGSCTWNPNNDNSFAIDQDISGCNRASFKYIRDTNNIADKYGQNPVDPPCGTGACYDACVDDIVQNLSPVSSKTDKYLNKIFDNDYNGDEYGDDNSDLIILSINNPWFIFILILICIILLMNIFFLCSSKRIPSSKQYAIVNHLSDSV